MFRKFLQSPETLLQRQLLVIALLSVIAFAVYYPPGNTPVEKAESLPATRKPQSPGPGEFILLWNHGQYEDLIKKATVELAKPNPPRHLTYLRGYAYRRIGWLDAAYKDFHSLGDFSAWPQYPNATEMATDIKALMALRPPIKHVVCVKGKIAFRVYTTANTPFSAKVIVSLPKGYMVASNFLGKEIEEIPVFIFTEDKYDQFLQFYHRGSAVPNKWLHAYTSSGTITIIQRNGNNSVIPANTTTLPRIITHEMTHVILRREVGTIKDFPTWFNEGAANMIDASLAPNKIRRNDRRILRLLRQNAILPLDQITSRTTFDKNVALLDKGISKSDPYAQGFHMTRYLRILLKTTKFSDFLALMRKKQSFEAAVKETIGLTTPQFYDAWLKYIDLPLELKEVVALWNTDEYDALIEKATLALAKPNPDKRITYLRGCAYLLIGWLDAAHKDFQSLGNFSAWDDFPNATKMAADMKALMTLRPPIKHVVRVKGKIAFRVYTTADTPFSANVIASLPKGYRAASTFLHKEIEEIPVYIFTEDKYDQFFQFYSLLGKSPSKWRHYAYYSGSIVISQRNGNGNVMPSGVTTLPRSLTNNIVHVFTSRLEGSTQDLPNWFAVGLADTVAASLEPAMKWQNNLKIQKLLKQGAILPLEQVTSRITFLNKVDQWYEGKIKANPYDQSFSMTRHLGHLTKDTTFSNFLTTMRKKRSFKATVKETTGLTMPQFYDSWLKAIKRSNKSPKHENGPLAPT